MTNRELFHATMRRQNGERLLHIEQGFTCDDGLLARWRTEGLPPDVAAPEFFGVSARPDLFDHFHIAKFAYCGFEQYFLPPFEHVILEQTSGRRIQRNERGVTEEIRTDGGRSLPHGIAFPVGDRTDYRRLRDRLTGNAERRVRQTARETLEPGLALQQDHIVTLWVHGPFGFLRELLGPERAILLPYDDPDLLSEMLEDHLRVCREAGSMVIEACRPDCCYVWEDLAGSSGPFVSPKVFRSMMIPWYRELKRFLTDAGVPWMVVDSDGNPEPLVEGWVEGGVDWILPWEVNCSDILAVARRWPQLILSGGICKHVFEPDDPSQKGRFATNDVERLIDAELERVVKPLRARGGYFPGLDHWVHPGVSYRGFLHYCRRLEERYGTMNRITRF